MASASNQPDAAGIALSGIAVREITVAIVPLVCGNRHWKTECYRAHSLVSGFSARLGEYFRKRLFPPTRMTQLLQQCDAKLVSMVLADEIADETEALKKPNRKANEGDPGFDTARLN